jgi:hypothetical protein
MAEIKKVSACIHEIEELNQILKHLTDDSNKAVGGLLFPNSDTPGVNYTKFSEGINAWFITAVVHRIDILQTYINNLEEHFEETNK